jgi:hypothetical protein
LATIIVVPESRIVPSASKEKSVPFILSNWQTDGAG